MTALRSSTARLLLERVGHDERSQWVRQIAASLDADSGRADVELAATLLRLHPDDTAHSLLLSHLQRRVEDGQPDHVTAVCNHHPRLLHEVRSQSVNHVRGLVTGILGRCTNWMTVPTDVGDANSPSNASSEESGQILAAAVNSSAQSLHFLRRSSLVGLSDIDLQSLLESCCVLVGATDSSVCSAAHETISSLLESRKGVSLDAQRCLWHCIRNLVRSPDVAYKTAGFSLWLRWALSNPEIHTSILADQQYWDLIVDGLRHGDSERRKAARPGHFEGIMPCKAEIKKSGR